MAMQFCEKCGAPAGTCTCSLEVTETVMENTNKVENEMNITDFKRNQAKQEKGTHSDVYYRKKFDNIVLCAGEEVVRQYHIGTMGKRMMKFGKETSGDSHILVTNMRVISKSDCEYMGSSSTSVEEISIENIVGVKNYYAVGLTIWKVIAGAVAVISSLSMLSSIGNKFGFMNQLMSFVWAVAFAALAVYFIRTCRNPSYLFSIYANGTSEAMLTGANLRGKLLNSQGYGIVFQYTPTTEAVTMMRELGACIMDIKAKGDYAVEVWKK